MADLLALAECPRAEAYVCITARREHGVRSAWIDRPTLAVVLRGRKRLHGSGHELSLAAGDLFVIVRPCRLDAFNWPDEQGVYLTLTLPLCDEVLIAARTLWAQPVAQGGPDVLALPAQRVAVQLGAWADALRQGEYGPARAALAGLLVHLCALGHTAMLAPPPPSLSARIRALVAEAPQRTWRSADFEAELGLSGATLRRRLAAEGTSVLDAVTEARLACAIHLLYTTHWPVKTVAARVGYRSAASFSRRFTQRYGLEPGQIGNG
ncbi:helix-turn-helix transcriptional regulator [Xenophilus sp.]